MDFFNILLIEFLVPKTVWDKVFNIILIIIVAGVILYYLGCFSEKIGLKEEFEKKEKENKQRKEEIKKGDKNHKLTTGEIVGIILAIAFISLPIIGLISAFLTK